jgi:hypothetical protein
MSLDEDYWRISSTTVVIRKCPWTKACLGGLSTGGERRLSAGGNYGDGYCSEGFEGTLCASCSSGFYLDADANSCLTCEKGAKESLLITGVVFGMVLSLLSVASIALFFRYGKEKIETSSKRMRSLVSSSLETIDATEVTEDYGSVTFTRVTEVETNEVSASTVVKVTTPFASIKTKTTVATKGVVTTTICTTVKPSSHIKSYASSLKQLQVQLKALTAFGQIAILISFNTGIEFPSIFKRILSAFSFLEFNFTPAGLTCWLAKFDYIDSMVAVSVGPIALAALLSFVYVATTNTTKKNVDTVKARETEEGRVVELTAVSSTQESAAISSSVDILNIEIEDGDALKKRQRFMNAFLLLSFLVLVSTSTKLLHFLKCHGECLCSVCFISRCVRKFGNQVISFSSHRIR